MIASPDQRRAHAEGTVELLSRRDGGITSSLVDTATGRFAGGVGFVESMALLAGPHAAGAIITITALTELAKHLNKAFGSIDAQLKRINTKLDGAFVCQITGELAKTSTSHNTAVEAEQDLRTRGVIAPTVPIGSAVFSASVGCAEAVAHVERLQRSLTPLTERRHGATDYVRIARDSLPFGTYELAARVALLAAWGVARVQCETVHGLIEGRSPSSSISRSQEEVLEQVASVGMFLSELMAADFNHAGQEPDSARSAEQGR